MNTESRSTELRGLRRLLPWSMRNFIASKFLDWSGSFAGAAMWIAPEMWGVVDAEEAERADRFDGDFRADDDFNELPF